MQSSPEEELAESHGERCQRVTAVTVALFDRQGAKYTDFPGTVAKSYAVLRSLISQDGNQLDNALFKITFYSFALLGWEAGDVMAHLWRSEETEALLI